MKTKIPKISEALPAAGEQIAKGTGIRLPLACLPCLFWLAGCHPTKVPPAATPPKVTVAPATERKIVEWNEYIARTDAVESVEVRARVSGYLISLDFKAGSLVKKGDLLFIIDPRLYQADLDCANGQLAQAQAQLKLAQADLDRARDLRQKNVITADEFDNRAAAFLQSQGTTSVAEAAVAMAKLNLEFCYIRAPISGRISRKNVTADNLVQPNTG